MWIRNIWNRFNYYITTHKKAVLIGAPIAIVLLFGLIVGMIRYFGGTQEPVVITTPAVKEPLPPVLVASLLNGALVAPENINKHVIAVMIENSLAARPQAGLTSADVIYEAVTEGGITRFMALYSQKYPETAGPIRSARSYFIDWLSEFDAFYVYAGGSPTALSRISTYGIKSYPHRNDGTFTRIPKAGVASEHTLFANISKIFTNATTKKGWPTNHTFTSWKFKDPKITVSLGSTLSINFSTANFAVEWSYDKVKNTYSRKMAGIAHNDRLTGAQITAKTIVVMTVKNSPNAPYPNGKQSEWTMNTIGTGNASVFIDGQQIRGTWKKPSRKERTKFFDETDKEITLNRGNIWIEVIPQTGSYTFTPETLPVETPPAT